MKYDEIVTIFQENRKIKFMLYNIEYFVIEVGGTVEIYPINDETRKKVFKNLDDLMNNYLIYNESLKKYLDDIIVIS